jgi:hypothetical protein
MGECTPGYMYREHVAAALHAYNPALKVVLILRHPVERAFSHWRWMSEHGLEQLPFWEALQQEEHRLQTESWERRGYHSYLDRSRYARQIERIWRYFPREQTMILKTTDLAHEPQRVLDGVCEFLAIPSRTFTPLTDVNTASFAAQMSDRERRFLEEALEPEVRAVESLLGWDCRDWRARAPSRQAD